MSVRLRLAALVACLLGSLALYLAIAVVLGSVPAGWDGIVGFSLPSGEMFRAFLGLPALELSPTGFGRTITALLVLLWGLWAASLALLRGLATPEARRAAQAIVIAGCVVLLAAAVVTLPPVLSADLYRQAIYGEMVARHHLNPYATPAAALTASPLLAFADHPQVTTSYGPAYTLLSALAAALVSPTPLGAALAWKATSALAALGCALLAAPAARALSSRAQPSHTQPSGDGRGPEDGREAQLLLAWNPLVVIEAGGSGHIEPIMMLPALAGILLLARGRPVRGFVALVVSTLTKWVTGLLLVLAAAREVQSAPPGRRLFALLRLGAAAAVTTALLYAPFASGLGSRGGIHDLALHGAGPLGDPSKNVIPQWAMMAGFALLIAVVARLTARRDWPQVIASATALMMVFIVVVVPWLFPWYFIAPVALSAILPRSRTTLWLRLAAFGLGAGVMLYYAKLAPVH